MTTHLRETVGYVNAGGRGTRLNGLFTPDEKTGIAKALLPIGNSEVRLIDHHIANFQQHGIDNVVVATGDQNQVFEYINDVYVDENGVLATKSSKQFGTGGDLVIYVRQNESSENILVQNVDTILDIDIGVFLHEFIDKREPGRIATIALTLNRGVPNEDAYAVTEQGRVLYSKEFCDHGEMDGGSAEYRGSSTGAVAIKADFLRQSSWLPKDGQLSLYRHILKDAWKYGGLFAYNNGAKFFRDIGTVATWLASEDDIELQRHLIYNKTK